MTEYGRGRAPEPWHPEDPLYGDQGWSGHEAQQGQMPYGGGPQQQYPQGPPYQNQQDPHAQRAQYVQYPQQGQHPQYPGQQQDYLPQQAQQAQQSQQAQQQQYQQQYPQQQAYTDQSWDTGQHPQVAPPYGQAAPADPYAGVDPYTQQAVGTYAGEAPDLYATPEAYPPPQPPGRRQQAAEEAAEEWQDSDVQTEEPDSSFFAGGGRDGDDGDEPSGGGRRSGRPEKKRRSGAACLIATLVILGVVGGGGYYGYTYLKARFGAAEDYAGSGLDESVDVEIPKGAGLLQMGQILKEHGVVASAKAFADAAGAHPKGKGIQPGVYTLKKKMSAAAAVELMADPTKLNVITVAEGMRNATVYAAIDKKLGQPEGTTEETAKREVKNLGLPAWADTNPKIMDPLEGFLYPARYDLKKDSTPESLLKQMVKNANDKYTALGLEGKAKALGLENPLQLVTVASLVQAEGMNHDDFRKMSEVVYNRLKKSNDVTNQKLEFDSTINYLKGTSNINVSRSETRSLDHPYNTYFYRGLTPGPIDNPGDDALNATLDPDKGGWMFFVSVDGKKTTFTKTFAEHEKLVAEFNKRQSGG
ncbi:endolytic transglycosylase MltG [Streptomyces sp. ISL-86]|uniref:endolytic transglycosylase MltG n=1 Tax=Streptomyces sp. ISL-86 TaxID=2819187 RepID=UPI001BEA29BA|nr:endolytic transglycosylase MltG [Streptomyces sp. ISL-86]MBT2455711.1 endolytic transglycosylase MltG [Streptomyces sp. ISL-86]